MKKPLFAVSLVILASFFFATTVQLRPFGQPPISDMGHYLLQEAQGASSCNNIVTAVVFDYRGFDTMGEATVLFAAIMGIATLFRRLSFDHG